ncbi:MAG: DUF6249 domain-containing protein [Pseudomonadota bacterium]
MTDELIGFSAVVGPLILLGVYFWLRYRSRHDMQETIRTALDKGHELSPELIDRLVNPKTSKNKDLRLGIIWLGIAAALGLCALFVPEPEAQPGLLMAMTFPACIGAAYMLIWRFAGSDESSVS